MSRGRAALRAARPAPALSLPLAVALAAVVAGCGGDNPPPARPLPGGGPVASATGPTGPTGPTGAVANRATGGRVAATFVVQADRLQPPVVTVPAERPVRLAVAAEVGDHRVVVRVGRRSFALRIGEGQAVTRGLPALRPGSYGVVLDGRRAATLRAR